MEHSFGLALSLDWSVNVDVDRDDGLLSVIGDLDWKESCGKGIGHV